MKLVTAYAYNYLGHYENCYSVPEGTVLPEGFTYLQPPLNLMVGEVPKFNPNSGEWESEPEELWSTHSDNQKIAEHMAASPDMIHQEAYEALRVEGKVKDWERMEKERHDNRTALIQASRAKEAEHKKGPSA